MGIIAIHDHIPQISYFHFMEVFHISFTQSISTVISASTSFLTWTILRILTDFNSDEILIVSILLISGQPSHE